MSSEKQNSPDRSVRIAGSILKARQQFFKWSVREKVLLMLFVAAIVFFWGSFLFDRFVATKQQIDVAHEVAKDQRRWLDIGPTKRAEYEMLIADIDLDDLPTVEEVRSEVDALMRSFGFNQFQLDEARTQEGEGLRFHTIPFEVKKVTFSQIKEFTEAFKVAMPNVSLERIVIRPQAKDDQFVDVSYRLKAIEYVK